MLIENKKAHFNYEFLEKLEAGIELFGSEVKSLRSKLGSLEGGHVVIRGREAFLINIYIPAFQPKNAPKDFDERRPRKLLLTKKEIEELVKIETKKGLTIVPVSVYSKGRKIKVTIAIAHGKKKFDKRETLKKRDADRDIQREMKG